MQLRLGCMLWAVHGAPLSCWSSLARDLCSWCCEARLGIISCQSSALQAACLVFSEEEGLASLGCSSAAGYGCICSGVAVLSLTLAQCLSSSPDVLLSLRTVEPCPTICWLSLLSPSSLLPPYGGSYIPGGIRPSSVMDHGCFAPSLCLLGLWVSFCVIRVRSFGLCSGQPPPLSPPPSL